MRRRLVLLGLLGLLVLGGGRLILLAAASGTPDAIHGDRAAGLAGDHRVALVFGAGLNRDGQPSALLRDRIRAAVELIRERRVDLLLMTGDNSRKGYDEPGAMRTAALALGVPAGAIAVDYGGRRTWDSCVRARKVFGVRHAITVSNDFHRARTVVLCRAAGVDVDAAAGTGTAKYPAGDRVKWQGRELVASWRGVANAWVSHPPVAVGGPPIDPYDDCAVWRSLSHEDRKATPQADRPRGCAAVASRT